MTTETKINNWTRVNNDVSGNPRYVAHFLKFVNDADRKKADELEKTVHPHKLSTCHLYDIAVKKANKMGGARFDNKQYGGGIVFKIYSEEEGNEIINEIKKY